MFRVFFNSHGQRAFGKAPKEVQQEISTTLETLTADPRWFERVKKLGGSADRYRLRIGRWRILLKIGQNECEVNDVFLKKGKEDYRRRLR